MCKLAVVILNWNGAEMMRKYLPSVVRCSQGDGVEVVVADNASTDGSVAMLRSEFPQIRIIELDHNYGFAEGYNKSLRQIDAEYYMLLNSDVEIRQEGWLNPMLEYMDDHADVAACQPKLLKLRDDKGGTPQFEYAGAAGGFIDKYGYPYCRGRIFQTVEDDNGQYDDIQEVMWVTGAAMMVRADVYWKAGGLDSKFFAHMEEIDLCWRMRIMGYSLACVPGSSAFHLGGATLNQGNARKTFLNFRNNRLMLYKNLPDSELRNILRVRSLLDLMAALQFLLKGDLANAKAVMRANREFNRLKPAYKSVRDDIQRWRTSKSRPDHTPVFLLWQYYAKGRRKFSELGGR